MTVAINSCPSSQTVTVVTPTYTLKFDYDINSNMIYFGKAAIGSLSSAASWQIRKLSYDVNSNLTDIQWASANDNFDKVWDNRTLYTYS